MKKIRKLISFLEIIICIVIAFGVLYSVDNSHINWNKLIPSQKYLDYNDTNSQSARNLAYIAKIDHIKSIPSPSQINSHLHQVHQEGNINGWLNTLGFLKSQKYYVLHFTYRSQLYPLYAPDACEASALRMALSTKGLAKHVSMKQFINRIPRSTNPKYGYTEDPYFYGDSASIYPHALVKYARKYYHANVKDISRSNTHKFIQEIKHNNPIVFEGAYQMRNSNSDHTLLIIGYRSGHPGQFLIADPFMWKSQRNKVFWTSTTDFMSIYKNSMRGEHALVVK